MSELRSVLDQLGTVDPDGLSPGELAEQIVEVIHGQQLLEVLVASWTKTLTDRGGHLQLGYPNPTAFLTHQGRMSVGHARRVVARANAVEKAPLAFAAWADARLSTDQAKALFASAETVPDALSGSGGTTPRHRAGPQCQRHR